MLHDQWKGSKGRI